MRRDQRQNALRLPVPREIEPWAQRRNNKSRRARDRTKEQIKKEREDDEDAEAEAHR
jgi:hypothetical protein